MKIPSPTRVNEPAAAADPARTPQSNNPPLGKYVPTLPPRQAVREDRPMPPTPGAGTAAAASGKAPAQGLPYAALLADALGLDAAKVSEVALRAALGRCAALDLGGKKLQHDDIEVLAPFLQSACPVLHTLNVRDNRALHADTLRVLSQLSELRELDFSGTNLAEQGHLPLAGFEHLERLDISASFLDDPNSLGEVGSVATLQHIKASGNLFENAIFAGTVASLTGLRSFDLSSNAVDESTLIRLGSLPHLEHLDVGASEFPVTGRALAALSNVHSLVLNGCRLEPGALKNLCAQLTTLSLARTDTRELPQSLLELPALRTLDVSGNPLDAASRARLEAASARFTLIA